MKVKVSPLMIAVFFAVSCLWVGQVSAQSYLSPGYIIGEIRDGLGIVQPQPAPDFVVRGRPDPAKLDYVPLKAPPRNFHAAENTPGARIEAEAGTIAELEAARAKTQARASGAANTAGKGVAKTSAPVEEDPPPMKWNAWDTE